MEILVQKSCAVQWKILSNNTVSQNTCYKERHLISVFLNLLQDSVFQPRNGMCETLNTSLFQEYPWQILTILMKLNVRLVL
jgi:hypothetical protein